MYEFVFFPQNGPVQPWPANGQMFLSPWQQGAAAAAMAQQPVIPETQPLSETWRRQYVPAAAAPPHAVSWRTSNDESSSFVATATEPSPAMFHMDVGEPSSSFYDHIIEGRPQFGGSSNHYTPIVTPQHQGKGTLWSSNLPQSTARNTHNRLARKQAGHK